MVYILIREEMMNGDDMMGSHYKEFFKIIRDLNDVGVISSRNYLDDVLHSLTKEFIPEGKVFFSSNCPVGRPLEIPYAIDDPFYIVLGANYPIGRESEVVVYELEKDRIRQLLKGNHYLISKEILLRMKPLTIIDINKL